jgi:hypothetical protein
MSSISSLSSSGGGYSSYAATRTQRPDPAQMSQDLFKKIDSDGSGGISADELQTALDALSSSGSTSAKDVLAKIDANGDGSVGADEFSQALQSGMPPPPPGGMGGPPPMSTEDFLRSRSSDEDGSSETSTTQTAPKDPTADFELRALSVLATLANAQYGAVAANAADGAASSLLAAA